MSKSEILTRSIAEDTKDNKESLGYQISENIILALGTVLGVVQALFAAGEASVASFRRREFKRFNKIDPNELPGPGDMVAFELREVFKEPFRSEQLQPPPSENFLDYMSELGYNQYFAESYWAAHWKLPSSEQAFEMFWRLRPGRVPQDLVFTETDLKTLLKRNDILPSYIDRLSEIAYAPYTRVDVRRMYRLGVMTREEVKESYMDIGYNSERAEKLTEFTIKDVDEFEKGITKSEIAAAYIDGVITQDEFNAQLEKSGYEPDGLSMFKRWVEFRKAANDADVEDRSLTRTDITDALELNIIDAEMAVERLISLGYDMEEAALIIELKMAKLNRKKK